ncbi:MAG: hypothetical protein N2170_02845 [Bacteroidia bacterium]|nr:hypothetical protein [Bacteroidia bacterium]
MTYLFLLWAQVFLGTEWGERSPAKWVFYGAEIRKTSAYQAPRAYALLLNGAQQSGLPYQTDDTRLQSWGDSALTDCIDVYGAAPLCVSFAYQRGGLMDPPEADDTLMLWGLSAQGSWEPLWYTVGTSRPDTAFTVVHLFLFDPQWYHSCFRLKWAVWGSTYGAYDNWLIAYTYIRSDTTEKEIFWKQLPRVYGGRFSAWPFFFSPNDSGYALVQGRAGLFAEAEVWMGGQLLKSWSGTCSGGGDSVWVSPPTVSVPGTYPIRWSIRTPTGYTVSLWDTFKSGVSEWAYDDGEMETGYGLRQAGRPFCQVFDIDTPQIIERVGVRFFPLPTQYGKPFQLGIWRMEEGISPVYVKFERVLVDSMGGLVWYTIDTPLVLQGKVGVGFIQADAQPLGVGWDASCPGQGRVWLDAAGSWTPSQLSGCLMVRIATQVASLSLLAGEPSKGWSLVPSTPPAGGKVLIQGHRRGSLRIWDIQGRCVAVWGADQTEGMAPTVAGLYVCVDEEGRFARLFVTP